MEQRRHHGCERGSPAIVKRRSDEFDWKILIGVAGVLVAFATPLIALELQKWLDERHESRNRKLTIFKSLMMYRVTPLSPHFVQSLNLVDLEFNGKSKSEAAVREQWKNLA